MSKLNSYYFIMFVENMCKVYITLELIYIYIFDKVYKLFREIRLIICAVTYNNNNKNKVYLLKYTRRIYKSIY